MKILIIVLGLLLGTSVYSNAQFYGDVYKGNTITYNVIREFSFDPRDVLVTIKNSKNILMRPETKRMKDNAWGIITYPDQFAIVDTFQEVFTPNQLHELYVFEQINGTTMGINATFNADGYMEEISFTINPNLPMNVYQLEKLEIGLKKRLKVNFDHTTVKASGGGYLTLGFPVVFAKISTGRP